MITSPCLFFTVNVVCVNVAVHPASHNCPIDNSPDVFMSGNRCCEHASGGSDGMRRWRTRVEVIRPPLGNVTVIGLIDVFNVPSRVPA